MGRCNWAGCERASKTVLTFIFSHIGLCALVAGYSVAGGFLFRWLEQETDLQPFNSTDVRDKCIDDIVYLSERFGMIANGEVELWRQEMHLLLEIHDKNVTDAVLQERYNKSAEDLEERWSIINALFYCVTVITTIGYGHISPRTTEGRIVTIVYSLFGIPLMLLCLNNIGDSMATAFRFGYRRIFCSCKKKKPPTELLMSNNGLQTDGKLNASWKPHPTYKPRRRNMLISPPISATIHRGSDHPAAKSISGESQNLDGSTKNLLPIQVNMLPSINEMLAESIVTECASYSSAPVSNLEADNSIEQESLDSALPSLSTVPSPTPSPLAKDSPAPWKDTKLMPPKNPLAAEDSLSNTSTRPASPFSGWGDQASSISCGASAQTWNPGPNYTVKWAPQYEDDEKLNRKNSHRKSPAGKTLVVYNTLSGDALKEQSRIQRKLALAHKAKHGSARNESTTVFTDPVSGQPVNGDMLGLNYRPIDPEPTDRDTRVPMTLVLAFVTGYLGIGAILFSSLETWTFLDALYFSFTTLSTIGFGDLVPGNLGFETREAQLKLVALALYVLLGLSVLAMSFNLVQEEVVLKCKAVALYIGLKDE